MLEIRDVSLRDGEHSLLESINARYPKGHFGAIIGPSGCGKTLLLKLLVGIASGEEDGAVFWNGRNLHDEDFRFSELSYVPQFSIAHEDLTVRECIECAFRLRVRDQDGSLTGLAVNRLLDEVQMSASADQPVKLLSGGQRRRLALAMEMTNQPEILLCDEVTSGLDPQAEDDIVHLLHEISKSGRRLVLSVTHSLEHLEIYDSVLVMWQGSVAYHGAPANLASHFGIDHPRDVYTRLADQTGAEWSSVRSEHQEFAAWGANEITKQHNGNFPRATTDPEPKPPSVLSQFATLLRRRLLVFFRNRAQVLLQVGLVLGFPLLVTLFAWNGLPSVMNLSLGLTPDVAKQFSEAQEYVAQASRIGSLVSGIAMFQVILLALMGANNSGREIAVERLVFEKEKLSGLSTAAYVASKVTFLFLLVVIQSVWMGLFVHFVCGLPGNLPTQLLFLLLVNTAITAVCLGISSLATSAEVASLVSIYLVGFQLPLSGAVLALPEMVGTLARPFIAAYWAWSGILQTLRAEQYYDIVEAVVQSPLAPTALCIWVLCVQIIVGVLVTWVGCARRQLP
jgi:ABC transport system ATP-binding/permease protein